MTQYPQDPLGWGGGGGGGEGRGGKGRGGEGMGGTYHLYSGQSSPV